MVEKHDTVSDEQVTSRILKLHFAKFHKRASRSAKLHICWRQTKFNKGSSALLATAG